MALIYDNSTVLGHYFRGTMGNDNMQGNGTSGVFLVGKDGHDELNPGINGGSDYIHAYGGWLHPSVRGVPLDLLRPGSGVPRFDGNDIIHFGAGIVANGGNGRDTYIFHGPGHDGPGTAIVSSFDVGLDHLRMDHSDEAFGYDGFRFTSIKVKAYDSNTAVIQSVHVETHSVNERIGEQHLFLAFTPDGSERETGALNLYPHFDFTGSPQDEAQALLHSMIGRDFV